MTYTILFSKRKLMQTLRDLSNLFFLRILYVGMQLPPVLDAMTDNPLNSKTITLSCGKLTTVKRNKFGGTKFVYTREKMDTMKQFFYREIKEKFPESTILYWT
jgi:hypothetical protein